MTNAPTTGSPPPSVTRPVIPSFMNWTTGGGGAGGRNCGGATGSSMSQAKPGQQRRTHNAKLRKRHVARRQCWRRLRPSGFNAAPPFDRSRAAAASATLSAVPSRPPSSPPGLSCTAPRPQLANGRAEAYSKDGTEGWWSETEKSYWKNAESVGNRGKINGSEAGIGTFRCRLAW